MSFRVPSERFRELPLEVHALLTDVPLQDVTAIDLPGGGTGRTIGDLRALLSPGRLTSGNTLVTLLFAVRRILGRLFGWDTARHNPPGSTYLTRLPDCIRARSIITPGTWDGAFRTLYVLEHEALSEIRNATVHGFLCAALVPRASGYRLYWGIYVKPTSRWTPVYMALIEPFRRFVVYPAIFRRIRATWCARYRDVAPRG